MSTELNPKKLYVRDYKELLTPACVRFTSRDEYRRIMGTDAPEYNPAKRTKMWLLKDLPIGPLTGRYSANVLAKDADTGEVISAAGKPFLILYSFSIESAMSVNIPLGIAGERRYPGPEAWLPLRDLGPTEHLEFASAVKDAGMAGPPFNDYDAFLIDDQYKPAPPPVETFEALLLEIRRDVREVKDTLGRLVNEQ